MKYKKLLLIIIVSPFISLGQDVNVSNDTSIDVGGKSAIQLANESKNEEGMFYKGNGVWVVAKTGGTGLVRLKKLYERCNEQISNYANGKNLSFKEINREDRKASIAIWPKVAVTYQLFNKDGTLALNDFDVTLNKDKAKKELLELKEFLDLGLISKEEFDAKAETLKKIILGN